MDFMQQLFNQQYIQQQAQMRHQQECLHVADSARKLKDFLDSINKIDPRYQGIASQEFCAIILDYLNKH